MDLVEDLANAYEDEALDLLLTPGSGPDGRSDRPAEILEIGSDWPSWRPTGWSNFFRFRCRRSRRIGRNHARRH